MWVNLTGIECRSLPTSTLWWSYAQSSFLLNKKSSWRFSFFKCFRKKVFKGHYETKMKEILLKEYEPQEAKRRVLKWSVFSKRKKVSCVWHVYVPRITYEWDAKWDMNMKSKSYEHILCIPYEWTVKKSMIMKEITLCAHHMNSVSCIIRIEC